MAERENRKELMIETAGALFAKHGYRATSTRQIAREVGCTEAALYYHFKDGKHGLLRAVMESRVPAINAVVEACNQAGSLKQALQIFAETINVHSSGFRWIMADLPQLSEAERSDVLDALDAMRQGLASIILPFMEDAAQADHFAWLMVCIGAGYQQLFSEYAFRDRVDISPGEIMGAFIHLIS